MNKFDQFESSLNQFDQKWVTNALNQDTIGKSYTKLKGKSNHYRSKLALKTSRSNKQTGWTTKIIELRVLMSNVITYYLVVLLFSMYVGNMIVLSFAMPFFLAPLLTLFTYP